MAHHVRIRQDPGWATGSHWTSTEQTALDNALIASVNGDGGGTGSPTANVVIQGAGLRLIATTHTISGAHSSITTDGATKLLTHGDSDYCVLGAGHSGATATIRSPIADARLPAGWSSYGIQNPFAIFANKLGVCARVPVRVHNGASFHGLTFTFAIAPAVPAIPAQMPRFGVFARDGFGKTIPLLNYTSVPTPASLSAWRNGGASQAVAILLAGTGPVIDTSQYSYFLQIIEASGSGALASSITYFDPVLFFNRVLDIRPR